jgi:uncharacterized protein YdaU (DUF1376 family)
MSARLKQHPDARFLSAIADHANSLSPVQTGAATLLLFYFGRTGKLPHDERKLACITRVSVAKWQREREAVLGALHKMIEALN